MKFRIFALIAACVITFSIVDTINHGMRTSAVEQA